MPGFVLIFLSFVDCHDVDLKEESKVAQCKKWMPRGQLINFIILVTKYYLYRNRCTKRIISKMGLQKEIEMHKKCELYNARRTFIKNGLTAPQKKKTQPRLCDRIFTRCKIVRRMSNKKFIKISAPLNNYALFECTCQTKRDDLPQKTKKWMPVLKTLER